MAALPFKVKAIYEYQSDHNDDLKFSAGQIIAVTELEGDEWYVGEYIDAKGGKQQGLFPMNFVERFEPEIPSRPMRSRPFSQQSPVPTAHAFVDESPSKRLEEDMHITDTSRIPEAFLQDDLDSGSIQEPSAQKPPEALREIPGIPKSIKPEVAAAPNPESIVASKPEPVAASKAAPPPVAPKSSAFKDRIAAFNKVEQPPIKPFQPGQQSRPSGFIKKPFVAPPPSSSSYIPAVPKPTPVHRPYVRDEDPEIREKLEQDRAAAAAVGLGGADSKADDSEAQENPKPMSLKERMALLQEQQRLQAERSAEASQRKDKPNGPKKSSLPPTEVLPGSEMEPGNNEGESGSGGQIRTSSVSSAPRDLETLSGVPPIPDHELVSGGEEADQSTLDELSEDDTATIGPVYEERKIHVDVDDGGSNDRVERRNDSSGDEQELDEEELRKQRLRERMARLAGPQGGTAMPFNPFGPPPVKNRNVPDKQSDKAIAPQSSDAPSRVPIMPLPGMQMVDTTDRYESEATQRHLEEQLEESNSLLAIKDSSQKGEEGGARTVGSGAALPKDRTLSSEQGHEFGTDSSLSKLDPTLSSNAAPSNKAPTVTSSDPFPESGTLHSPGPGSESDDEMSTHAQRSSAEVSGHDNLPSQTTATRFEDMAHPPPLRPLPQRPTSSQLSTATGESSPSVADKRVSRAPPPVPGQSNVTTRAAPPPPPTATMTEEFSQTTPNVHGGSIENMGEDSDESDYEGDYDTDIASGDTHKDALKSHAKDADTTRIIPQESEGSGISLAQRAVPPLPISGLASTRSIIESPRSPPPIPIGRNGDGGIDYDPYRYADAARASRSATQAFPVRSSLAAGGDESSADDIVPRDLAPPAPARTINRAPPPPPPTSSHAVPVEIPIQAAPVNVGLEQNEEFPSRLSSSVQRPGMSGRRSIDHSRPIAELEQIATDIELNTDIQWWTADHPLPPALQTREGIDILSESERTVVPKRGGRSTISKDIYVLYIDYSQSIFSIRYDSRETSEVAFEQRHESPPPKLRQDQLEACWNRFGSKIGQAARSLAANKKDSIKGDGLPHSLPLELIKDLPSALLPVGTRAYGALVYANLANASTMQFDEIRTGDIVTLRNARFEGHHGAIKQKYKQEYGTHHVAVVDEWDGTKRSIRTWEQGRDKKGGVRSEKFRLGDLRSGELRVWRVVGRDWVGWESGN